MEIDFSACLTCSLTRQLIHFYFFVYVHLSLEPPSVKPSKAYSRGSVVMVDEIMNASPSKFRFPEAGLRVMVTSHFGPKTRLRMASRLIITEVRTEAPVVAKIKTVQLLLPLKHNSNHISHIQSIIYEKM